jgi:hypothetical protein
MVTFLGGDNRMTALLYLDYNCFQRGFDDQRQPRIRMEATACDTIFGDAERGLVDLIWSFMHEDENRMCPFPARQEETGRLSAICSVRVGPDESIRRLAQTVMAKTGIGAKDALHLAAAHTAKAAWFVTCDDDILRKARQMPIEISIVNPVDYILKAR